MRTAQILQSPHAHGKAWQRAFADGLKRHGVEIIGGGADLLVTWGVRARREIDAQLASGGEVCVLECGYYGDRLQRASVSLGGGLNGRGRFAPPRDSGERFAATYGPLSEWKAGGDYALICGQVPGDLSLGGRNMAPVYQAATDVLGGRGERVVFRPHPNGSFPTPRGAETQAGTLAEALAGAKHVVAFNSNALTDAVLAGVPAIALDRGAMAWPVAGHGLGEVIRPDRADWATWISWTQYDMDEIASGFAWEAVNDQVLSA